MKGIWEELRFTVDAYNGIEVELDKFGDIHILRIENIEAWGLGYTFVISAGDFRSENKSIVECGVMTYCYNVLRDTSGTYPKELKNLLSALRAFQLTSEQYVENMYGE